MSVLELSRVKPFFGSDKETWESYDKSIYSEKISSKINSKHIPVSVNDLSLIISLNSLGSLKINPIEAKSFSNTHTIDAFVEGKDSSFQQVLLSTIRLYPSNYKGKISPESLHGCDLIASRFDDIYDRGERRFQRRQYLENDYLGILADEESVGNTLIAFDNDWTIVAVNEYISNRAGYEIIRSQALREDIATLKPVFSGDQPIARWQNRPKLFDIQIPSDKIKIYSFNDSTLKRQESKIYMIFAPVSADEAEKIYLYLYRDIKMYSFFNYLVVKNLSLPSAKDFQYLFPVKLGFIDNYVVFKTDKMLRLELKNAFELNEMSFQFSRLDSLIGCYATYLLAEATWYQYEMRWEDRTLYLKNCGYIQGLDIREHFISLLNKINNEQIKIQKLANFSTAIEVASQTGSKCFYFLGDYYAALPDKISVDKSLIAIIDPREIEMFDPLRAIHIKKLRSLTLEYLSLLGYSFSENPEVYHNNIQIGYRTFQNNSDIFTIYYYNTTHGEEIDIHEISGRHNPKIKEMLELLLQQGFFFDQKTKNITTAYPDFIPSYAPINRILPKEPEKLMESLSNLTRK